MSGVPVFRAAAQIEVRTWPCSQDSRGCAGLFHWTAVPQPSRGPCPRDQHLVAESGGQGLIEPSGQGLTEASEKL